MLKKPSILLSSYSLHQCWSPKPHQINTSPSTLPPPRARPSPKSAGRQWRSYADVHSANPPNSHDEHHWPDVSSPSALPTPYEIFRLEKSAPYSKQRFYELVKIYHPDRNRHEGTYCGGVSHVVKLERYRMIIAAHEILSDPVKRSAYDRYGTGWNGQPQHGRPRNSRDHAGGAYRPYGTGPGCDNSPFQNATWEDWEQWYARSRDTPRPAKADFMDPNAFAVLVIVLAVIAGAAQGTRLNNHWKTWEERIKTLNEECGRFLSLRREETASTARAADERVQYFLKKRDPSGLGLKEEEEETYRSILSQHQPSASRITTKRLSNVDRGSESKRE